MSKFAKLFETEDLGQIVVMRTRNDDGEPQVSFTFEANDCQLSFALTYSADDKGEERSGMVFAACNEENARSAVSSVLEDLKAKAKEGAR